MASKYLQKYPVPAGFQQILHDFTRQVLRDQPENIIEYAANYFEMLEQGKKFEYESKTNVKKSEKKTNLEYNSKAANEISAKAKNAVNLINQNIEKQQNSPDYKPQSYKEKVQPVEVYVETEKEEKSESSNAKKHPSIQDVAKNVEDRPVSGVSKKSQASVGFQPSTNTMMNTEGRKFMNQVNLDATKQIVNQGNQDYEGEKYVTPNGADQEEEQGQDNLGEDNQAELGEGEGNQQQEHEEQNEAES